MTFKDSKEFSSWAKESIYNMVKIGVIKGITTDKFSPRSNVTIEQAVLLANRLNK